MTMAYSSINFFMAIYGGSRGIEDIGLFFTVYAVCLFISRPLGGRIADRYGSDKVIIPGIALFALSFVLISFSKTLPMFLLDGAVCAFGYGICMPTLQALSMSIVPKERRGAAGNTNYIGIDLGSMIGPVGRRRCDQLCTRPLGKQGCRLCGDVQADDPAGRRRACHLFSDEKKNPQALMPGDGSPALHVILHERD